MAQNFIFSVGFFHNLMALESELSRYLEKLRARQLLTVDAGPYPNKRSIEKTAIIEIERILKCPEYFPIFIDAYDYHFCPAFHENSFKKIYALKIIKKWWIQCYYNPRGPYRAILNESYTNLMNRK